MDKVRQCKHCGSSLTEGKCYCARCGCSAIDLRAHVHAMHGDEATLHHLERPKPKPMAEVTEICPEDIMASALNPDMLHITGRGVLLALGVVMVIVLFMSFVLLYGMTVPDETRAATSALCHTWKATEVLRDDSVQKLDSLSLTFSQDGSYRAFVDLPSEDGQMVRGKWSILEGKITLDPRLFPEGTSNVRADFSFGQDGKALQIGYKAAKSNYLLSFVMVEEQAQLTGP